MKRDSYSDQQAYTSFQPRSSQPAIEPTQLGQPVHHSSSTSDLGAKWLSKASGWMADKLQTAQNFVNGSGDAILQGRGYANAPDQILPALKGTVKPALSQADRTNQPLVGVIDAGFGTDEHGSKMVEAIQKENPQARIWQGGGVGTGGGLESLTEFVDVAKATGQRAVANLSFDLTEVHPDGSSSTRARLTAKEQSALSYARDNGVLVVASSGNQGGAMSALGQASQPSDNLIVVGAASEQDRASYSSYGNGLDLVADVGTTGTSLAAAKVTGTIAKLWSANPGLNSQQVEQMLTTTATNLKTPGWDAETGAGLLNSTGAIALATHTAPEPIVFSGTQLMQQVSGSLGGATWESRDGAVASERTNRSRTGGSKPPDEPYDKQRGYPTSRFSTDPKKQLTRTERARFWKAAANDPNTPLTPTQREEIRKTHGRKAPSWLNPLTKSRRPERMEASHEPADKTKRNARTRLVIRWDINHAQVDPQRNVSKEQDRVYRERGDEVRKAFSDEVRRWGYSVREGKESGDKPGKATPEKKRSVNPADRSPRQTQTTRTVSPSNPSTETQKSKPSAVNTRATITPPRAATITPPRPATIGTPRPATITPPRPATIPSGLKPVARVAGRVLKPLGAAVDVYEIGSAIYKDGGIGSNTKQVAKDAAVGWAKTAAGAGVGAAIGSVVPVIGTGVGALAGGIIASFL